MFPPRAIAVQINKLTHILNEQGRVTHSIRDSADPTVRDDSGLIETISDYSDMDLAQLFGVDLNTEVPEERSPPEMQEGDEVEMEDVTEEDYPTYHNENSDDLPDFAEYFRQHARAEDEAEQQARAENEAPQPEKPQEEWVKKLLEAQRLKDLTPVAQFRPFYLLDKSFSKGRILSWAYFSDLKVFAVKKETGIDYFEKVTDLKTLPYPDMFELTRHDMLYCEGTGLPEYVQNRLRREFFKKQWIFMKPQWPKKKLSTTKFRASGEPAVIWIYKPARVMKRIPLRRMPQNFSDRFIRWFYDCKRTEATIVLGLPNGDWEAVRVFDPMWLRNLSHKDIETLYNSRMGFAEAGKDQAMRFVNVIKVLHLKKPHNA